MPTSRFSRRQALRTLALSAAGCSTSRFLPAFAADLAADPARRRHCILLWMTGGPSQIDTFDMKPGHANGGPFKEIATAVPGMRFSEYLPKLAAHAGSLAILRGLSTKEGDHARATELMHTGHLPMGPIRYPTVGSSLSKALARGESDLPSFVSVNPFVPYNVGSPGFLGAAHAPLTVGSQANYGFGQQQQQPAGEYATLTVDDAQPRSTYLARQETRLELWRSLEGRFLAEHPHATAAAAHRTVYERAIRFMTGAERAIDAFDLSQEPDALRQAYGRGTFGQGCLLARRLVERGVAFVEVAMNNGNNGLAWDTHQNNFRQVASLSAELDAGWATLLADLKDRGLLESTTILWMGEFGRTPTISDGGGTGRDHFADAWSAVLAGGGIQGGAVHGRTSADGRTVEDGRIEVGDLLATLAAAVGVRPETENISEMGRPIKIAEGKPVAAVLA